MVELHTLGDATITVGRREIRPSSPLAFAALLYLATERGRRVPRAALQEMLFPETDERSGAHSLRQLLYKLRQFGVPLEADASSVLLPADRVRDDTAEDAEAHGATPDLTAPFLPDYHPVLSERFTEWLDQRRDMWAGAFRKRLVTMIQSRREVLDWPAVERHARALLNVDPLNEVGIFAQAESTALSGGKAAAIRMLTEYEKETGRRDLQLPAALLRRRISESVPDQPAPMGQTPFIGREPEVLELRKQIAVARRGRASLYVLGGDPGIGKSRLLREVSGLAALEGMRVFTVRCQSHYASRPMSVFIELVPALRGAPGALGIAPTSVTMLNLLTSHADSPTERASDARDDITRSELLLTAIRDLVDAVAGEQPLLVGVEDAHWADRDSLRELNRLVQGVTDRPLMVVCTTRSPETFPFAATTDDRTVVRRLKPLEAHSMEELAEHLLPSHGTLPRGDLVSWSVRTSGGNPLFLQMLCGHYAATGEAFAVPPDMSAAVMRRVQQLPEHSRHALAFVALLGKHATLDAVRALAGWDHVRLFEAVQRLEEEHYIYQADDTIRISHDLLSECVLSLIPPLSRRVMHSSVAAALEARYDDTNDAGILWDCAEQWVHSGEPAKAIEFLRRCARHAIKLGRATEAVSLLERADQLCRYPAETYAVCCDALLASRAAGFWPQACQLADRAARLSVPVPAHSNVEIAAIDVRWTHRLDGKAHVSRLLNCVKSSEASDEHRLQAAQIVVRIAHEVADGLLAQSAFREIEPLLVHGSTVYGGRTLAGLYHVCFGDAQEGLRLVRLVIASLGSFVSFEDEVRCAANSARLLMQLGHAGEATNVIEKYYERCRELGLRSWEIEFAIDACAAYTALDDLDLATHWHRASNADVSPTLVSSGVHLRYLSNSVELAIARGDRDEALATFAILDWNHIGDSVRGRAFFKAMNVRALQLDPLYQLGDAALVELEQLFEQTKTLLGADPLALAYAEGLRRCGLESRRSALLTSYLTRHRRELTKPGPALYAIGEELGVF